MATNWLNQGLLLVPWPQELVETAHAWELGQRIQIGVASGASERTATCAESLSADLSRLTGLAVGVRQGVGDACVRLGLAGEGDCAECPAHAEGYALTVGADGVTLIGRDEAGLAWGAQTLTQLVAFRERRGAVPGVRIRDWPHYALRGLMLDMGRAPFTKALIKRVIRIMARLKLNLLQLHVHDNELNGARYATLPLGSENPAALSIADYAEIIRYAAESHVMVMPELEAWGHVASLIYHYPELYGTTGAYGQSFGAGEPTYALLEAMFAEWMPVLQGDPVRIHVGLDEADWSVLPEVPPERRGEYTPVTHIQRLYDILQRLGERHGKRVEMHLWADHGGRPLPEGLAQRVVIEPWQYHLMRAGDIGCKVAQCSGEAKTTFMMGAGASVIHEQGAFSATKLWCRAAMDSPNCRGVMLCFWGSNDVAGRLITGFAGADYAWSPASPPDVKDDVGDEDLRGKLVRRMRHWQCFFLEAAREALDADRGPEVIMGLYAGPERVNEPAGPTAFWEDLKL